MRFALKLSLLVVAAQVMTSTATEVAAADILGPGDIIMIQGSPTAIHFNKSDDHSDYSWLVGVEWQSASRWLGGLAYFNNSFDQKCQYVYGGKVWPLGGDGSNWYFKLTGGLVLGYKDPYENKIPINSNGVGLGILPSFGYKFDRFNVQVNVLGTAGIMITAGYDLFR